MSLIMNTETQKESVPKTFVRGATLEFLMELPKDIPATFFDNGGTITTTLAAKLRSMQNAGESGLICDLNPTWESGSSHTKIRFYVSDTTEFPLGPAEFDVVFTKTKTGAGAYVKTYRSNAIRINITDGVT